MLARIGWRTCGPSGPSGQYASAPPSRSENHATPVAMWSRHSSKQPGVVHHHEQPLRDGLAADAAELGHVGVHRELLARDHEVGVRDLRLDDRPAVHGTGRVGEPLRVQERRDRRGEQLAGVRVLLAEVAGAGRERADPLVGGLEPTRPEEVHDAVVALGEAGALGDLDRLELAVGAVPAEAGAQLAHRGLVGGIEDRVDGDDAARGTEHGRPMVGAVQ